MGLLALATACGADAAAPSSPSIAGGAAGQSAGPVVVSDTGGANGGLGGGAGTSTTTGGMAMAGAAVAAAGTAGSADSTGGTAGAGTVTPDSRLFTSVDFKGECRHGVPELDGETHVVVEGAGYDVVAYGSEMGHHCGQDQGRFLYVELTGDFDVWVQVAAMNNFGALHFKGHTTPVKSGLMVRQGLAPADPYIAIHAASPDPNYPDAFHFDMRREVGGWLGLEGTFSYGYLNSSQPIFLRQLPNIWVRLQRIGNLFKAYASQDGQSWLPPQGHAEYTADWGSSLYVGLSSASAPEGEFNAKSATEFRNLAGFPAPSPP